MGHAAGCDQVRAGREFAAAASDAAAPVVSGVSDDAIVRIVADLQRRVKLLEGGMGQTAQAVQSANLSDTQGSVK